MIIDSQRESVYLYLSQLERDLDFFYSIATTPGRLGPRKNLVVLRGWLLVRTGCRVTAFLHRIPNIRTNLSPTGEPRRARKPNEAYRPRPNHAGPQSMRDGTVFLGL